MPSKGTSSAARSGRWLSTSSGLSRASLPEARPDAVGEQRDVLVVGCRFAGEIALLRSRTAPWRRPKGGRDRSRSRRRCPFERGKPFMEKPADEARLAQRQRRADRDAADRAVHPEQQQLERPRAFAAPFEVLLEAFGEQEHQPLDILDQPDRLGEMPLHRKRRHGQARRDDFLDPAQRLVEPTSSVAPKRRASGARGAAITDPTVRRPTLSRPASLPASSRRAASGRGSRKCCSSPRPE